MGIYIKGMEMPKSCFDCPFMYGRKYCSANSKIEFNDPDYSELKGRYDGCPLAPVPPNGRLIDADKIGLTDFEIILCQKGNPFKNALKMLLEKIENAPTIIPASEEKMK